MPNDERARDPNDANKRAAEGSKTKPMTALGMRSKMAKEGFVMSEEAERAQAMAQQSLVAKNRQIMAAAEPLYNQLNRSWDRAEEFFRNIGVLAPPMVPYGTDDCSVDVLGIQKIGGKWRVCVGNIHHNDPEQDPRWKPIVEEGVELRAHLLHKLPELLEALVKTNESVLPRLQRAIVEADHILNSLGAK